MRNKALLLALTVVVACGAGPMRGANPAVVPGARQQAAQPAVAQIAFKGADGMTIQWDVAQIGAFDSIPVVCKDTKAVFQNFQTAHSYRLKLANIPNRDDLTLYPTLTINAVTPRTRAYLDHNAIPVKFTENDFDQVQNGNFVTKVVFLPSAQYQNLARAGGVDTIVNTQLPAGADPIVEAQNRGAILAVIQIGNKDLSLDGLNAGGSFSATVPGEQIPISGVNVPAWGTPAQDNAKNVLELPTVPAPKEEPVVTPVRPVPSTSVPEVEPNWLQH